MVSPFSSLFLLHYMRVSIYNIRFSGLHRNCHIHDVSAFARYGFLQRIYVGFSNQTHYKFTGIHCSCSMCHVFSAYLSYFPLVTQLYASFYQFCCASVLNSQCLCQMIGLLQFTWKWFLYLSLLEHIYIYWKDSRTTNPSTKKWNKKHHMSRKSHQNVPEMTFFFLNQFTVSL